MKKRILLWFPLLLILLISSPCFSVCISSPQRNASDLPAASSMDLAVRWIYTLEARSGTSAAIIDLDQDNRKEILVGLKGKYTGDEGAFYCINYDGSIRWLFPTNRSISTAPVAVDLDQDGEFEILVGPWDWYFYCIDERGALKWAFTDTSDPRTASVADLFQNGTFEILFGDIGGRVFCLSDEGEEIWCYDPGDYSSISTAPAIADLDADGLPEILVGANGGYLFCLNYNGSLKWIVESSIGTIFSSTAIGDLDTDGTLEIIFTDRWGGIHCLDYSGEPRWSYQTADLVYGSLALADLTGDGHLEALAGSTDGKLYCLSSAGSLLWSYVSGGEIYCTPTIADLNNDSQLEVIFSAYREAPQNSTLYCLDHLGNLLCQLAVVDVPRGGGTNTVADLDGDGIFEIISCCSEIGLIYCFEVTGVAASGAAPWACYQGSMFHTGWGDSDSDFIDDFTEEWYFGTNPQKADSDGDSFTDGEEYIAGTDPLDPADFPRIMTTGMPVWLIVLIGFCSLLIVSLVIFIGFSTFGKKDKKLLDRLSFL